jgi:hypothetical protein
VAFYRTYIADILGALSPQDFAYRVQSQLAGLMSACTYDYENSWVYFADTSTKVLPTEALVYFVPPGLSIIKHSPNLPAGPIDLGLAGNTNPNSGASEVYVKWRDETLLAKLAFHELMHNRLQLGNAMHRDDGLRTGRDITPATPYTDQNKRDMAAALKKSVPQWVGGISILTNGKNDPLSEYHQI